MRGQQCRAIRHLIGLLINWWTRQNWRSFKVWPTDLNNSKKLMFEYIVLCILKCTYEISMKAVISISTGLGEWWCIICNWRLEYLWGWLLSPCVCCAVLWYMAPIQWERMATLSETSHWLIWWSVWIRIINAKLINEAYVLTKQWLIVQTHTSTISTLVGNHFDSNFLLPFLPSVLPSFLLFVFPSFYPSSLLFFLPQLQPHIMFDSPQGDGSLRPIGIPWETMYGLA